jgi:hypothetical protein
LEDDGELEPLERLLSGDAGEVDAGEVDAGRDTSGYTN